MPQTHEILAQSKTRYRLAVVSDAQSAYGLPELRAVGLADYFAPIVISGDYGYRKPDARLFQSALTELEITPEEAIYIGNDRFRDFLGARKAGMKTILLCPNGTFAYFVVAFIFPLFMRLFPSAPVPTGQTKDSARD